MSYMSPGSNSRGQLPSRRGWPFLGVGPLWACRCCPRCLLLSSEPTSLRQVTSPDGISSTEPRVRRRVVSLLEYRPDLSSKPPEGTPAGKDIDAGGHQVRLDDSGDEPARP